MDQDKVEKGDINQWYARGQRAGPAATKFRKGACENCGAMTHKRVDCMERPRKKGAKFTGKNIAADEIIEEFEGGYDAKRDRWNGYDPSEHKKLLEEYAELEKERARLREEEIDNQTSTDLSVVKKLAKVKGGGGDEEKDPDFGSSDEDDADEEKYADAADAVGQKLDTKTRITVRNLRIREDTAKYLINLDPESAYYDPKTRSMRDAPDKSVRPEDVRVSTFEYRVLKAWTDLMLNRPNSLGIISSAIQVMLSPHRSYKSFRGRHHKRETTWTYMPIQQLERSIIMNIQIRRTRIRRRHRYQYSTDTVARSICRRLPKNCYWGKQKVMSSIQGRAVSSRARRELKLEVNTKKTVRSFII